MKKNVPIIMFLMIVMVQAACNLPSGAPPDGSGGEEQPTPTFTLPAAESGVVFTDTPTATPVPAIVSTDTASPTPLPQDPLVVRATLCWQGPGGVYEVVSALKANERVKLLGRGSISGWYVVDNPIYHDPCWVAAGDLQIDAGTDLAGLKIINPPPTATPTKPPTYTPTPVPTLTPVP